MDDDMVISRSEEFIESAPDGAPIAEEYVEDQGPIDVITAARDLIADADQWCETDLARDKDGRSVDPFSVEAVSWCAVGAIYHVAGDIDRAEEVVELMRTIGISPDDENDSDGHEMTVAVLDRTVESLQILQANDELPSRAELRRMSRRQEDL